ncbi:hypothetical protein OLMES_0124 [Oleiphilus messinensis]|uniref:DUF4214 domain-containing protein n=2 Tax=Oleiphilus messinensis TaxID=141451 RepID=A0A1Y0I1B0_9GAMM|nr:hypothetical protein OLMES_0124 [Oleiphilus messinensis]
MPITLSGPTLKPSPSTPSSEHNPTTGSVSASESTEQQHQTVEAQKLITESLQPNTHQLDTLTLAQSIANQPFTLEDKVALQHSTEQELIRLEYSPTAISHFRTDSQQLLHEQAELVSHVEGRFIEEFAQLANDPEHYHQVFRQSYGSSYDKSAAESLREKAIANNFDFLPKIRLTNSERLNGNFGAYAQETQTVFLNIGLDVELMAETYIEEVGHHLEQLQSKQDAIGDEGERFRLTLSGNASIEKLMSTFFDDDSGQILISNQPASVEFSGDYTDVRMDGTTIIVSPRANDKVTNPGQDWALNFDSESGRYNLQPIPMDLRIPGNIEYPEIENFNLPDLVDFYQFESAADVTVLQYVNGNEFTATRNWITEHGGNASTRIWNTETSSGNVTTIVYGVNVPPPEFELTYQEIYAGKFVAIPDKNGEYHVSLSQSISSLIDKGKTVTNQKLASNDAFIQTAFEKRLGIDSASSKEARSLLRLLNSNKITQIQALDVMRQGDAYQAIERNDVDTKLLYYLRYDAPEGLKELTIGDRDTDYLTPLLKKTISDKSFIDKAYSLILKQDLDKPSQEHFSALLESGELSRTNLLVLLYNQKLQNDANPNWTAYPENAPIDIAELDNLTHEEIVNLLYERVLGYEPGLHDPGFQWWVSELQSNQITPIEALTQFIDSEEAQNFDPWLDIPLRYHLSNEQSQDLQIWLERDGEAVEDMEILKTYLPDNEFVEHIYHRVLNRDADQAGLNYWVNELESGNVTRAQVIDSFANTIDLVSEMRNWLALDGGHELSLADYHNLNELDNTALVQYVYQNILNIPIETNDAGVTFWVQSLNNQIISRDDYFRSILESPEYQSLGIEGVDRALAQQGYSSDTLSISKKQALAIDLQVAPSEFTAKLEQAITEQNQGELDLIGDPLEMENQKSVYRRNIADHISEHQPIIQMAVDRYIGAVYGNDPNTLLDAYEELKTLLPSDAPIVDISDIGIGAFFGASQFGADTLVDVSTTAQFATEFSLGALDSLLWTLSGENPAFETGKADFAGKVESLITFVTNIDQIPGAMEDNLQEKFDLAHAYDEEGDLIGASKYYTAGGLEIVVAALGLTALVKTGADIFKQGAERLLDRDSTDIPNTGILPRNGTGGFIDPNVVDKISDVRRRPTISSDGKVIPYGKTEADAITIRNKRNLDADGYLVKGDQKLKYNEDGFPIFDSKYDTVLDDAHFGTQNEYAHFQAANESLARQLRENPGLANEMGLTQQQVKFFEKVPAEGIAPPGLTWHHHQDLGRMQLVDDVQHKLFKHTGGMSIWGGGYK